MKIKWVKPVKKEKQPEAGFNMDPPTQNGLYYPVWFNLS